MKRTTIFIDDDDRHAVQIIRDAHGLATDSSAIRFAVRELARQIERGANRTRSRGRTRTPHAPGGEA